MPAKNRIKTYVENGLYHIYNRGVEKRNIFNDREDYTRFLYLLKIYLSPSEMLRQQYPLLRSNIVRNNLNEEIDLLAFCLMPNHFHLLVKQKSKQAITRLMSYISTSYVIYFNKRNRRLGPLFQDVYKGVMIDTDEYLLHLSRYIHLNPLKRGASIDEFEWSSYLYYLGKNNALWVKPNYIKGYFSEKNENLSYQNFVESNIQENTVPKELLLEEPEF